jgi:hypothetical protein
LPRGVLAFFRIMFTVDAGSAIEGSAPSILPAGKKAGVACGRGNDDARADQWRGEPGASEQRTGGGGKIDETCRRREKPRLRCERFRRAKLSSRQDVWGAD